MGPHRFGVARVKVVKYRSQSEAAVVGLLVLVCDCAYSTFRNIEFDSTVSLWNCACESSEISKSIGNCSHGVARVIVSEHQIGWDRVDMGFCPFQGIGMTKLMGRCSHGFVRVQVSEYLF